MIPSPIIIDILSRLPPKDIARNRCICKQFNNFISDPEFINLHFSRSPPCFLLNNLSSSPPESNYFSLVEFHDHPDRRHDLHKVSGIQLELPKASHGGEMKIVGVLNGLVCLRESRGPRDTLYIWNPTLGEFITFLAPEFLESSDQRISSYGFGLASKKGIYKVVRVLQELGIADSGRKSHCHVYTLGTGSWRNIENVQFHGFIIGDAIFLEGNLHFVSEDGSDVVYCLDIEKERLKSFPSPPLDIDYRKATINLYNGCLCVCDNTEEFDVKVWVMKNYGVEKSWTKLVEITEDPISSLGNYFNTVYFVRVFVDGEILILLGNTVMFFRRPDGRTWDVDARSLVRSCESRIGYHEEHYGPTFEVVEFVPSFVSLKEIGEPVFKVM